ncbi:putative sodium-dependent multivitamin transporter [Adelges cooleyi]|uniref:putative sodium-dependent multivitamin transporter n=1 Tax=Adelges cooleyi TaxID=133065 RepID=UPI00217F999D|nr:putative sodium-dependent multivitamin transporter [Adelges cooleyi]XP_050430498.1 putative sodium-dependent multivitamin transporter [Adelges cooleyi]XP_050430499.1 putative sodium-dependent multivitamin transporter [Adelges cooleyi]XP_050430501.1 putative sodium-dependent multivitamin transporter [Adelges cooleyi]XP_050430502.1 putative sodium-dependent multivitamin transporter [Adelges cooleyi]XP_050430503.1 putative sodium-dependent multivitamin transporter [Adelges cooleyi]XP_05043050
MAFGIVDYIVFGTMLSISASIGVYYRFTGGKQKTTQEYMLGNKNQSLIPVAFSLMASFMSAISLFGGSAENYSRGTQFAAINIGYILGTPIIAYIFLPVFFKLGNLSVYEYLEKRFGKLTRIVTSLAFSVQMILYMSIVLYAPALALEAVTGLSQVLSILLVGLVCVFYSTIGGIKAVIITDLFQSLLMFASIYAVIGVAMYETGGISEIWRIAKENDRIEFTNFNIDPTERHSVFSLVFGGMFTYLSLYAINQTQVQRYLTMKDYRTAVKSLWISLPILSLLSLSTCFSGLAIYSKYYKCDPVKSGRIASEDQLMPLYVLDTMGNIPGLTGLFVAGIFSSALSSVSPVLNSLAAVTMEDYIKPLQRREISDTKKVYCMKIIVLCYGGVCILLAFLAKYFGSILQTSLIILGVIGGPVLAVFTLGVLVPCVNQNGALSGLIIGLIFSFVLGFGGPKPVIKNLPTSTNSCTVLNETIFRQHSLFKEPEDGYIYLYRISYLYYIILGFIMTFIVGLIVSAIFRNSKSVNNPDLFTPFIAKKLNKRGLFFKENSIIMKLRQNEDISRGSITGSQNF